jgi:hypothetical protein
VNFAIQELFVKWRNRRRVVVDSREGIVYYRPVGRDDRLGPLEKRIILILAQGALSEAEIARKLGAWPQAVHEALKRLRGKDLVKSWPALGENLAGTKVFRRFYFLNSERVQMTVPVGSPTEIELQRARERAQREAIRREREGILLERLTSPKPSTRLKALINQGPKP